MLGPLVLQLLEDLDQADRTLMVRMLHDHSQEQIRWSCRAILTGTPLDDDHARLGHSRETR